MYSKAIKVLLVDDEEPARVRLQMMLMELELNIHIIGEVPSGKEAIEWVRNDRPDLLFLDIQMPVLDGFDVIELLGEECPPIIFVTAYDEYAIKAFEVHAIDYLLKPVRKERLRDSLCRFADMRDSDTAGRSLRSLLAHREYTSQKLLQKIPVSYKKEIRLIDHDQILWFEADGKITWVNTADQKRYRCDFSLANLENRLADASFLRIHRSVIANMDHVKKLEPWFKGGYRITLRSGTELEVARRRVEALKEKLGM